MAAPSVPANQHGSEPLKTISSPLGLASRLTELPDTFYNLKPLSKATLTKKKQASNPLPHKRTHLNVLTTLW